MVMLKHPYPPFPLKGQNCQCRACGLLFRRTSTFDAHRVGRGADRRCQTSTELAERGFTQDARGFWKRPGPKVPIGLGTFA